MKENQLKFKDPHTEKERIAKLQIASYEYDGTLYIGLYLDDTFELFDDITVNISREANMMPLRNWAYINDPFGGIETFLLENKLAEDTGIIGKSGFCTYKLFRFDADKLKQIDPEGYAGYIENFED